MMECKKFTNKDGWTDSFHLLKDNTLKIMQWNKDKTIYREIHIWGGSFDKLKELLSSPPAKDEKMNQCAGCGKGFNETYLNEFDKERYCHICYGKND